MRCPELYRKSAGETKQSRQSARRCHNKVSILSFRARYVNGWGRLIFWGEVALTIGQTAGNYRVIDVIGSGGMGTVYKVQHLISDRIEAMKLILPNLIDTPELADRFVREIKVQARLSHQNIASLHNAFRFENQLLMVMEYVDGTTLHARLKEGRISPQDSIETVLQVLSALAYAHAQGVIHRDIKPANIMFTSSGLVKLMDFGIARSLSDQQLTQTGAAVGSVYYMSPEQVQAGPVDNRSDLYSVGIVLYEMVTGLKPITGGSSWAIMNGHINQIPRAPAALNSSIPPALSLATLKALEKNPAFRYQTASEFADVLRAVRTRFAATSTEDRLFDHETIALPHQPPSRTTSGGGLESSAPATPPAALATPLPDKKSTPAPSAASRLQPKRFDAAELDRVKRELAAYVGPMARIIVDRAAKKAANLQQLYELVAAEVPEGPERRRFLGKRPK